MTPSRLEHDFQFSNAILLILGNPFLSQNLHTVIPKTSPMRCLSPEKGIVVLKA
jgi:hypothetical protein